MGIKRLEGVGDGSSLGANQSKCVSHPSMLEEQNPSRTRIFDHQPEWAPTDYIKKVAHRVYLEVDKKRVFAASIDWFGGKRKALDQ